MILAYRYNKYYLLISVDQRLNVHQKPKHILHYTNLQYALSVRAWIYKIL